MTGAPAAALRRWTGLVVPPVLFGIVVLALWQGLVRLLDVKSWVLAAPTDIWHEVTAHPSQIAEAAGNSGLNALIGLVIGCVVGVLLAALCSRVTVLGHAITPLVAALAAIPIVCLAPVLMHLYGLTSAVPRRGVVAIAAFVPMFINTLRGLGEISTVHQELMSSLAASRTAVLRLIRLPGSLPHLCTGLRVAASLAVISAVVSEYFGGLQNGLGFRISDQAHATNYPGAWAAVLGAVVLGLLFFLAALLVERLVLGRRSVSRQ